MFYDLCKEFTKMVWISLSFEPPVGVSILKYLRGMVRVDAISCLCASQQILFLELLSYGLHLEHVTLRNMQTYKTNCHVSLV